jgi:hypothetical protein
MKKFFAVLAIAGVMISCKDKKTDENKTEDTTTTTPTDNTSPAENTSPTDNTTPSTSVAIPTFSDPEVQKFANDYAAFIYEYKTGMKDPARMADLSKKMQDWSTRSVSIGTKLATTPGEAQKWAYWVQEINKVLLPEQ